MNKLRSFTRALQGKMGVGPLTAESVMRGLPEPHFNLVMPGTVRQLYKVPDHIPKPYYLDHPINVSNARRHQVQSTEASKRAMREAGALAAHVLATAARAVEEGISTEELDVIVFNEIIKSGAYPSPLGYRGYPKSCCTSINNIVCHGIPDDTRLLKSDVINIDVAVFLNGHHGDTSATFVVGEYADDTSRDLVDVTQACMQAGIDACTVGTKVLKVQQAMHDKLSELRGNNNFVFDVLFSSHGIGTEFHSKPDLHTHLGSGDINHELLFGQTLTVEPIVLECESPCTILEDNWTCTTTHPWARTAQFEHTIMVTDDKPEILTLNSQ